jgi:hypothetical protein
MYFSGQITEGVYDDEWADIDENELSANLGAQETNEQGTTGEVTRDMSTPTPSDTSSDTDSEPNDPMLDDPYIRARVEREIKHRPIPIKRITPPFTPDLRAQLLHQIATRNENHRTPLGFGLHHHDDNYSAYNPIQTIRVGPRKPRSTKVTLPREVWHPRIVLWVQSVWELTIMQEQLGNH